MNKFFLFAAITALLASCSTKPKYELEVNIHNNNSLMNKKFIVSQMIEGKTVYADTTKIKKNQFVVSIPYDGPGLLNISIPSADINDFMMAAGDAKGKVQLNIEGTKPHIAGTPLNDRLQAFYQGNDSVSSLFDQLEKEKSAFESQPQPAQPTPTMKTELQQQSDEFTNRRTQLLKENTDRIIAFIKENVDNPVGEYYFLTNYITFTMERKLELNSFATPKLKKEIGLQ